jgi:hypothetical protein
MIKLTKATTQTTHESRVLRPAFGMRHRGSPIYFCDFERGFFDGEMKRIRGSRSVHK